MHLKTIPWGKVQELYILNFYTQIHLYSNHRKTPIPFWCKRNSWDRRKYYCSSLFIIRTTVFLRGKNNKWVSHTFSSGIKMPISGARWSSPPVANRTDCLKRIYRISDKTPWGCTTARRARWIRCAGKSWATYASTTRWPRRPSTCNGTRGSRSGPTAWCTGCASSCFTSCPRSCWTSCFGSPAPNPCTYKCCMYSYGTIIIGFFFLGGGGWAKIVYHNFVSTICRI